MKTISKSDQNKILEELRKRVIEKDKFLKEKKESNEILKANKESLLEMTELTEEEVNLIEKDILKEFENKITKKTNKKKVFLKFFIIAILFAVTATILGLYFNNMLENKRNNFIDYKNSDNEWKTLSWRPSVNFYPKNMEIDCIDCNHARWIREFQLKSNTFYKLSFLIKVENVDSICITEDAGSNPWGANVWIYRENPRLSHEVRYYGTSDWQEGELTFNTGEGDNVTIFLQIGGHGGLTKGKAWFKNIGLTEL